MAVSEPMKALRREQILPRARGLGRQAALALELFQREAARGTRSHELQFQPALACLHLGDPSRTCQHLAEAIDASPATAVRDLHTAKLGRLQRQAGG